MATGGSMDLLIRGGTVVTMDAARSVRQADVWVRSGRIVAVGDGASEQEAPTGATRVLDARDCAVMPGLVQAHVHLCQTLFRGMAEHMPLMTWLRKRIWPLEAAHDERSIRASARLGLAEMLRAGTTSLLDMGTVHHQDVIFEEMKAAGVRGLSGKSMVDRGRGLPKGFRESTQQSLADSQALCARWQGQADGRLGYAFAPRFVLSCSERLLRATAASARAAGALIHTHAAEHADERRAVRERLGCDDIEALRRTGIAGPDVVLAHGVQLRASEMRSLARSQTRIAHCPSTNLKLGSGIAPVVAMRRHGLTVGLGADGAPCNNRMDPWTELRSAALLAKGRERDARALQANEALALATIEGARVLGLADQVGSLEVGKRADIIVVRLNDLRALQAGDVYTKLVYSCGADDVQHVVIGGRLVVRAGELLGWDLGRLRADVARQTRAVVARAGL